MKKKKYSPRDDEERRDKKYTTVSTIKCLLQVRNNNELTKKTDYREGRRPGKTRKDKQTDRRATDRLTGLLTLVMMDLEA